MEPDKADLEMSTTSGSLAEIRIRPMHSTQDAEAFKTLNEEWIVRYFVLEKKDRETLNDPGGMIVRKGGQVFVVEQDEAIVGCAALIPIGDGRYELSKMAVSPQLRGLGLGRRLLEHVVAEARLMGARYLFLGSSTRLKNAVHLYESVGFHHVEADKLPAIEYARSDVFMEMWL